MGMSCCATSRLREGEVERGEVLLLKPRTKPDLTKHFDIAKVEVDPKAFSDYSRLKRAILGRGRDKVC